MQEAFVSPPPDGPGAAAVVAVERALEPLAVTVHRPEAAAWGLRLSCAGWPLDLGIALRRGVLLSQAEVLGPGKLSPGWLLHRNRRDLRFVRYATSAAGAVWVHGELHERAVTVATVDELLGRLVVAAEDARQAAASNHG